MDYGLQKIAVFARSCGGAGQDRAGTTRTCQHLDDAEHLHARWISHCRAVEEVERQLFGDVDPNGPKLPRTLETAAQASSGVN
jgi:hypothetical protein